MQTRHRVIYGNAGSMQAIRSESVDLVVTSPPYPMIAMWDEMFSHQSPDVGRALKIQDGFSAFEAMHRVLDPVWGEVNRVLKTGGFVCINVGDATRTINGNFGLYPNHMRIIKRMLALGFTPLPCILWRKQTNAPNKFMGSGMLPAGAYVTLEHEYILIFRKGPKRVFSKEEDKKSRRESAIFWEERNLWYSDVWFDVKGALQALNNKDSRKRSAAYPFEIVYRLINMYSVKGAVVLDPFSGTGTTTAAAVASGRNSIGYEIDSTLECIIERPGDLIVDSSRQLIRRRLAGHLEFVVSRLKTGSRLKYVNQHYGFPVMTAQERDLIISDPLEIRHSGKGVYDVLYADVPQKEFMKNWETELQRANLDNIEESMRRAGSKKNFVQSKLF